MHNLCSAQQRSALFQLNGCIYCLYTIVYNCISKGVGSLQSRLKHKVQKFCRHSSHATRHGVTNAVDSVYTCDEKRMLIASNGVSRRSTLTLLGVEALDVGPVVYAGVVQAGDGNSSDLAAASLQRTRRRFGSRRKGQPARSTRRLRKAREWR